MANSVHWRMFQFITWTGNWVSRSFAPCMPSRMLLWWRRCETAWTLSAMNMSRARATMRACSCSVSLLELPSRSARERYLSIHGTSGTWSRCGEHWQPILSQSLTILSSCCISVGVVWRPKLMVLHTWRQCKQSIPCWMSGVKASCWLNFDNCQYINETSWSVSLWKKLVKKILGF